MSARVTANVIDRSGQSGSAKLLLVILANYANDEGTNAYPSYGTLAEKLNITERQVKRLVADLVEQGELSVIPRCREDGSSTSNMYQLSERYLGDGVTSLSPHRDIPVTPPSDATVTPRSIRKEYIQNNAHVREESGWNRLSAAVCRVTLLDGMLLQEKEKKVIDALYGAGYTAEQVLRYYGSGGWWWTGDWRGDKGQRPDLEAIRTTIQKAKNAEAHPEEPKPVYKPKSDETQQALATFKSLVGSYGWPNWDMAEPVVREKGLMHVVENLGGWTSACRLSEYDLSRRFAAAYAG